MMTVTTSREAQIRQFLKIRHSAAMALAVMPSWREGTTWAIDRYKDVAYCNRQLSRLGYQD